MQTIPIDKAGRLVLPKPIRDRIGLRRDSRLQVEEVSGKIVLSPVEPPPGLIRDEDGWLIFNAGPAPNIDWDRLVDQDREDRIREIGGW